MLTSAARVGFMARSGVWTRESTTPVNANLTITGAAKTTFATSSGTALNTITSYGDKFAASAGANVVGTLVIDASPDSVTLDLPDIEGRKAILAIHAAGKPFAKDIDWERTARRTVGFTGADLENMLNEAAILIAREDRSEITNLDLEEAATKVKMGPEKKRMFNAIERDMTAYHEAGHALVTHFLSHTDPVHRISIVSRGIS